MYQLLSPLGSGISPLVIYNVDIFSPDLARRYAERLGEILTAMVEGRSIEEILELGRII